MKTYDLDAYYRKIQESPIYSAEFKEKLNHAQSLAYFARDCDENAAKGIGKSAAEQGLQHYHDDYENLILSQMQRDSNTEIVNELKRLTDAINKSNSMQVIETYNSSNAKFKREVDACLESLKPNKVV